MRTFKKVLLGLFFLFCIKTYSFAQNVNIPDQNFKDLLLEGQYIEMLNGPGWDEAVQVYVTKDENYNYIDIDLNNDNEIQESEAQLVYYLEITNQHPFSNIQSMIGINSFVNLRGIFLSGQLITELDVSELPNLHTLKYYDNINLSLLILGSPIINLYLKNINLSNGIDLNNCWNLETIYCENGQLSSLDLSQNNILEAVDVRNNFLTQLNTDNNLNLSYLAVQNNQISNLDLSNNLNLKVLFLENNSLGSLDVSYNPNLENLYCSNNSLVDIDVSSNPDLQYLICNNNQLQSLNIKNGTDFYYNINYNTFDFSNNPDLSYICADGFEIDTVMSKIASYGYSNVTVNTACNVLDTPELNSNNFVISPNPTSNFFTINGIPDGALLTITDVSGKVVFNEIISNLNLVDVKYLNSGVYFINVFKDDFAQTQKLMID